MPWRQINAFCFAILGLALCIANMVVAQTTTLPDRSTGIVEFQARDSLQRLSDPDADAQACLDALTWDAEAFRVQVKSSDPGPYTRVHFPSPRPIGFAAVDRVTCEWYAVRSEGESQAIERRRAVVVVHESGSDMVVGRMIASEIQRRGVHAFLVQLPGYGERKAKDFQPDDLISVFAQGLSDVRRARDAIAVLPQVDSKHIALQGTSLGGFVATMAAGLDDAFDSNFLLLCGGDLHGVLTTGEKDAEKTLRKLLATGVTLADLRDELRRVEPLRIAHRIGPKKTFLYSAMFDRVVPPTHSDLLSSKIDLPSDQHTKMLANHYSGVIYLPGIVGRITETVNAEQTSD